MTRTRKTADEEAGKKNAQKNTKHDDRNVARKEGEAPEPRAPFGKTYPQELPNEDVRDRSQHDERRNDNGKF